MSASTEKKLRQAAREAGNDKKQLAAAKEAEAKAKSRRRWTLGTVAVVLLVAVILFLNSGFLYKNTTALSIGDENYSPAELNYYYANQFFNLANQYGDYAMMLGLDTSTGISGLGEQECPMIENGTWKDYFLDAAKNAMAQTTAVLNYAKENGIELSDEEKAAVDADLDTIDIYAQMQGFSNADNFLGANYGTGVDIKVARSASYDAALFNKAVESYTDSVEYTAQQLKEKYDSYEGEQDYYEYAYYYIMAESVEAEDGSSAATDETKAAAKAQAQAVLDAYNELEDEDIEARLNKALEQAGVDGECTRSRSNGSAMAIYKDWVMSRPAVGEASVQATDSETGFYVVAFIDYSDNDYNMAQVRHILVKAEADENGEYTEQAKAQALSRAQELLEQWKSGEATEESFAQLATEHSEDAGSSANGGLYDNVMKRQMVEEFDAFCFGGHKSGDTAIVYGESDSYAGYHVMYYVGEGENARDYIAANDMRNADVQTWMEELVSSFQPVEKFWLRLAA